MNKSSRRTNEQQSHWLGSLAGVHHEPTETSSLMQYVERTGSSAPATVVTFENALQMAKIGKLNFYLIVVSGIIMATSIIETLSISFVLPASGCEMQLSSSQKGVLSAVGFAGIITSSYFWGYLSDTKGRRAVMIPSLLVAFLFTVLSSLSPNFWLLITFRYLHGVFIAGSSGAVFAYLGEFHTNNERARAIMSASVVFGIACVLMPLVGYLIINDTWELPLAWLGFAFRPWRLFMVAVGLPSLVCGVALIWLPESPNFVLSLGNQAETVRILQWMYLKNGGDPTQVPRIGAIGEEAESIELRQRRAALAGTGWLAVVRLMWSQTVPLFRGTYLRSTLVASAMQFGNMINTNGMYMWFPETVNRVSHFVQQNPNRTATICQVLASTQVVVDAANVSQDALSAEDASSAVGCGTMMMLETDTFSYTFALEILYAVGFACIASVIKYFGNFSVLVFLHLVCAAAGFTMLFLAMPMVSLYMYLCLLIAGLIIPVLNAATIDLYPTSMRGMAVCLTLMLGRLGGVFGVNMVALLIEDHCQLTFGLAGAIMLVCGVLTFCIPNIMNNAPKPTMTVSVVELSIDKDGADISGKPQSNRWTQ